MNEYRYIVTIDCIPGSGAATDLHRTLFLCGSFEYLLLGFAVTELGAW